MKSLGGRIQTGIYYIKGDQTRSEILPMRRPVRNNTFAILFLRVLDGFKANQVGRSLNQLWKMYGSLKEGKVREPHHSVPTGELSVLIGYGQGIFELPNVRKDLPNDFKDRQFLPPAKEGGNPILRGSGIKYAHDMHDNLGTSAHIVVQFISTTQLPAYRAVVETWKYLRDHDVKNEPLRFLSFYTGFQRDDGRSWLGFHDELSNMETDKEREGAIAIDEFSNNLRPKDFWTKNGTYLAYLRIDIDLDIWRQIDRKHQELIVGRDKLTGYPLVGVDKKGNPMVKGGCPGNLGTDSNDAGVRDHPDFFKEPVTSKKVKAMLDLDATFKIMNRSHVGRTRHLDGISSSDPTSRRIYRQSFEFLEPHHSPMKPFRAGLNFVSFQNDPGRLLFILTDPNWLGNTNFGGDYKGMENLVTVIAAGIFFVPPVEKPFPGASILI